MKFRISSDAGTKQLNFQASEDAPPTVIDLGPIEIPTEPAQLFEFIVGTIKEHGLVDPSREFTLRT